MHAAYIVAILLALSAAPATAQRKEPPPAAAEKTPQAQEEKAAAAQAAKPAAAPRTKQKAAAPKRKAPRRAVRQTIVTVPPVSTQSYGPVLNTQPQPFRPLPGVGNAPPVVGLPPAIPAPPAQLNSCIGNLCTDAAGATYNKGPGNAAVNSQGRLCNQVGTTMQCF